MLVTLTRPDKHNALDAEMFEAIVDAAERVTNEPGVRAVVLHGEGPSFSSGLDMLSMISRGEGLDGLLVIGAYREDGSSQDEVDATHPLGTMLSRWGRQQTWAEHLRLDIAVDTREDVPCFEAVGKM